MLNFPNKSWFDKRVEVRKSAIAGKGSFASAKIKKGEVIIKWGGGVVVTNAEFEKGFKAGKYKAETAVHFDADHKWVEDATAPETPDAYLNHSCDPNLWFVNNWEFAARRDIAAGEELTFDYATGETYPLGYECNCGSAHCRKNITGQEWKNKEFQKRYRGHFCPYIQGLLDKTK